MRTLKLTFGTSGKSNFTLSIDNAKDDLTLETVRQEAAKHPAEDPVAVAEAEPTQPPDVVAAPKTVEPQ